MTSGGKTDKIGKVDQRAARKARLAAALRQNLKRRKQQARQRAIADSPSSAAALSRDIDAHAETASDAPDFRRNRDEE